MSVTLAIGVDAHGMPLLPWLAPVLAAGQALQTHSILIHGAPGAGQFEACLLLAQAWLCESLTVPKPCGRCTACALVRQHSHPDLLCIIPEDLRLQLGWVGEDDTLLKASAKPSRDIRIEQVRQAIAWSHRTTGRGRGKALLLHPAEALNGPSANALLKTLEEPMAGLRLLLACDDPELLLPTLRSRCQRLQVELPPIDWATAWLTDQGTEGASAILALAGGSPLLAVKLVAEGIDAGLIAALPRQVARADASGLISRPVPRALDMLFKLCHDCLAQAVGGGPRYFDSSHLVAGANLLRLLQWQASLMRVARHADHPWNAGLAIEALVAEGARAWQPMGVGQDRGSQVGA